MIHVYPYNTLGTFTIPWLKARYHFSFGEYHNPQRIGFGKLLVINDDTIRAGGGFEPHGHRDMEIITYVRQGAITHEDSQGNKGRTEAGDVQVMSAGSGIRHSEHNLESIDTKLYQIWIRPRERGIAPYWNTRHFPKEPRADGLTLLVTGRPEEVTKDTLYIHQYASIYGGNLTAGAVFTHTIKDQAYLLVSEGEIIVDGTVLHAGDGAEITQTERITIQAQVPSALLIIDVPND